jgi:hypothetical protein
MKESLKPLLACVAAAGLAGAMVGHVPGFQGWLPSLPFEWSTAPAVRFFAMFAVATAPWIVGLRIGARRPVAALLLIASTILIWRATSVYARSDPRGAQLNIDLVHALIPTSYHWDALRLVQAGADIRTILHNYPRLLPHLVLHSQKKPPGPVLFYFVLLRAMGQNNGPAIVGLITIAIMDAVSVLSVYWLAKFWTHQRETSILAAALFCLAPGFLIQYPKFDSCYPAVVCAWTVLWGMYLRTGRYRYAIAFGALFTAVTFWVYNLFVWGPLIVGLTILEARARWGAGGAITLRRAGMICLITLASLCAFYGWLYWYAGFDPITTFKTAVFLRPVQDKMFDRSFRYSLPIDLLEFTVGVGWGTFVAAVASLAPDRGDADERLARSVRFLCFGEIAVVAASGLLRGETSRVWLFLFPLIAIPGAAEIVRWPGRWRAVFLGLTWLTAAAILQNLRP